MKELVCVEVNSRVASDIPCFPDYNMCRGFAGQIYYNPQGGKREIPLCHLSTEWEKYIYIYIYIYICVYVCILYINLKSLHFVMRLKRHFEPKYLAGHVMHSVFFLANHDKNPVDQPHESMPTSMIVI